MASSLWQRISCCLTGHDYVITSDRTRMFLRCRTCGRTSHGLELSENRFRNPARNSEGTLPASHVHASRSPFSAR